MLSLCLSCSTKTNEWSVVFDEFFITDHNPINFDHFFTFTIHCSVTLRKQFAATWAKQSKFLVLHCLALPGKTSNTFSKAWRAWYTAFLDQTTREGGAPELDPVYRWARQGLSCFFGNEHNFAVHARLLSIRGTFKSRSGLTKLCPNKNFPQLRRFSSIFRYQCIIHFILIIQL